MWGGARFAAIGTISGGITPSALIAERPTGALLAAGIGLEPLHGLAARLYRNDDDTTNSRWLPKGGANRYDEAAMPVHFIQPRQGRCMILVEKSIGKGPAHQRHILGREQCTWRQIGWNGSKPRMGKG